MRIVCAGAGFTSIEVAAALKQNNPNIVVTVINKSATHTLYSHTPELLSGVIRLESTIVHLEKFFRKAGVEFIHGNITYIDREQRLVHVGDVQVHYDYLLLDLGSETNTLGIPGLEHSMHLRGPNSVLQLRQHIVTEIVKARNTNKPEHRTFVIAGAGVTGVEIATELNTLLETLCEQHMLFPHEYALVLVQHPPPAEYPWSKAITEKIKTILEDQGIEYYTESIRAYTQEGVELPDRTIETRTLVWTAAKRANNMLERLGITLDPHGAAVVNNYLQTSDPNIFAAGDNSHVNHKDIPRTAFVAFDEQRTILANLQAAAQGKPLHKYNDKKSTPILITTGKGTALLIYGNWSWHGKLPYKLKNWIARKYAHRVSKHAYQ